MAQKVIVPQKKNYVPQFLKQRDINSYCNPQNCYLSSQKYGIGIQDPRKKPIPDPGVEKAQDPGVKKEPDPESRIRVRNTVSKHYQDIKGRKELA